MERPRDRIARLSNSILPDPPLERNGDGTPSRTKLQPQTDAPYHGFPDFLEAGLRLQGGDVQVDCRGGGGGEGEERVKEDESVAIDDKGVREVALREVFGARKDVGDCEIYRSHTQQAIGLRVIARGR